ARRRSRRDGNDVSTYTDSGGVALLRAAQARRRAAGDRSEHLFELEGLADDDPDRGDSFDRRREEGSDRHGAGAARAESRRGGEGARRDEAGRTRESQRL